MSDMVGPANCCFFYAKAHLSDVHPEYLPFAVVVDCVGGPVVGGRFT